MIYPQQNADEALKGRTPHKHMRYSCGDKSIVSRFQSFDVMCALSLIELKESLTNSSKRRQ